MSVPHSRDPTAQARPLLPPTTRGRAFLPGALAELGMLDLSFKQRDTIREITKAARSSFWEATERLTAARVGLLQEAVMADTLDESTIWRKAQELAVIREDLAVLGARIRARIRVVLTEDQIAQAARLKSNHIRRARARVAAARAYVDLVGAE